LNRKFAIAALMLTAAAPVWAGSRNVLTAPAPAWVLAPPQPTAEPAPPDAVFRFVYNDTQLSIGADGQSQYTAYRVKLLKPEALAFGNISLVWSPENGNATVHSLRIWRDGTIIDVLKASRFSVLQREGGLEAAALDGLLTAALQVPGLQLGDELEFSATVRRRDPVLGARVMGVIQLPVQGLPGAFRARIDWPVDAALTVRATRDLPPPVPVTSAGRKTASFELRDPAGSIPTEGAPARYNQRRQIEYSSFSSWAEVSQLFRPFYDQASVIGAASPLRAEIGRIKAASTDPAQRAMASLRLVQDQIRYVYVGLNDSNYRPSTTEETWQRRFGDCKAKTALLLGMLRELGIEAEAVLVNPDPDGFADRSLPSPGAFNHVLVRARLGEKSIWLDGTRLGDRYIDRLPPPTFRWALPLTNPGATLEAVPARGPARPQYISAIDVNASTGFAASAKVLGTIVLRDDEAFVMQSKLASLSPQDAERAVKAFWREQQNWVEADRVSARYDDRNTTITLSLEGTGIPDWKGEANGRYLSLWGAGFTPPDTLKRPKEQDQSAAWLTNFPRWRCWATTVHLPNTTPKLGWMLYAEPMNAVIGGTRYWRASSLTGNIARTVMSRRVLVPEISAAEAVQNNAAIPAFNNNQSTVSQVSLSTATASPAAKRISPFSTAVDWPNDATACGPQDD
jgi:hypothetical protein